MPRLANEQWELFAQGVAKGLTFTRAYEKAGYEPHQPNASRLICNDIVAARVAELQDLAAQKCLVSIEKLTDELEEARNLAMADDKGAAAAVSAVMAKAKLHGLDVNKTDVNLKGGINVNITQDDAAL